MDLSHSQGKLTEIRLAPSYFFSLGIVWYLGVPEMVERVLEDMRSIMSSQGNSTTMVVYVTLPFPDWTYFHGSGTAIFV